MEMAPNGLRNMAYDLCQAAWDKTSERRDIVMGYMRAPTDWSTTDMFVDGTPSWNRLRPRGRPHTITRAAATLRGAGGHRSLRSTKRTYSRWTC
eukprot:6302971-Pyramimonas_sp.AAC.1